jgi:hypothetical protein
VASDRALQAPCSPWIEPSAPCEAPMRPGSRQSPLAARRSRPGPADLSLQRARPGPGSSRSRGGPRRPAGRP